MLKIRAFTKEDGDSIASWLNDEAAFYLWSAGRLGSYPIDGERLCQLYAESATAHGLVPYTVCDRSGIAGHFTARRGSAENERRLGFIIVNPDRRGLGYGREMLALAKDMLFEDKNTDKLTLGVFETNTPAIKCYSAVGFCNTGKSEEYLIMESLWRCLDFELKR